MKYTNVYNIEDFMEENSKLTIQDIIINLYKLDDWKRQIILNRADNKIKKFILNKIKNSEFNKYEFVLENTTLLDFFYRYGKDFIISLNLESQYELINSNLSNESLVLIVPNLKKEIINYFFENDSRAIYLFDKFNILELINRGIKFNDNILKKREFFNMLKSSSFMQFRKNINASEKYNNALIIEDFLQEYYEDLINDYNENTGLFKQYEDILDNIEIVFEDEVSDSFILSEDVKKIIRETIEIDGNGNIVINNRDILINMLKEETNKKISEIIIDALFRDNIYNVWLNIKEMLRYNNSLVVEDKVLDSEKVEFYNMILNFDSISSDGKIQMYNALKDKNINSIFYTDLRNIKDKAYDKIKQELFNPLVHSEYINDVYSKKVGCNVFDLRDKKYTMLVRVLGSEFNSKGHHDMDCYSIISDESNLVIRQDDVNAILYGYSSFDNDTILHMFESDAFSHKRSDNKLVNRIMTSRELVTSSECYNEVQIVNKKSDDGKYLYDIKKPDFIVVYDNINDRQIKESKRLGITIVIISKAKLINYESQRKSFDFEMDSYDRNEKLKKSAR